MNWKVSNSEAANRSIPRRWIGKTYLKVDFEQTCRLTSSTSASAESNRPVSKQVSATSGAQLLTVPVQQRRSCATRWFAVPVHQRRSCAMRCYAVPAQQQRRAVLCHASTTTAQRKNRSITYQVLHIHQESEL